MLKISRDMARFVMEWHQQAGAPRGYQESSRRITQYFARLLKLRTCCICGGCFAGQGAKCKDCKAGW